MRHPAHPGVFALGIECDGYMYHSSPGGTRPRPAPRAGARRSGLAPAPHLGNRLVPRPRRREQRLRAAIEAAINAPVTGRLSGTVDHFERAEIALAEVDRSTPRRLGQGLRAASVAAPTALDRPLRRRCHGSTWSKASKPSPATKAPSTSTWCTSDCATAWDIGRVGPRIKDNIRAAIHQANVIYEDDFLDTPLRRTNPVRVPEDGRWQRTADQIPEAELQAALTNLLRDAGTATEAELCTATARIFGWNRRGPDITNRLQLVLKRMNEARLLAFDDDRVRLAEDS